MYRFCNHITLCDVVSVRPCLLEVRNFAFILHSQKFRIFYLHPSMDVKILPSVVTITIHKFLLIITQNKIFSLGGSDFFKLYLFLTYIKEAETQRLSQKPKITCMATTTGLRKLTNSVTALGKRFHMHICKRMAVLKLC